MRLLLLRFDEEDFGRVRILPEDAAEEGFHGTQKSMFRLRDKYICFIIFFRLVQVHTTMGTTR